MPKNKIFEFKYEDQEDVAELHLQKPKRRKKDKEVFSDNTEKPLIVKFTNDSHELKIYHILTQFMNDVHEMVLTDENFNIEKIEKLLINNIETRFNRTHTAKLMGISVRTVRNKMNVGKHK